MINSKIFVLYTAYHLSQLGLWLTKIAGVDRKSDFQVLKIYLTLILSTCNEKLSNSTKTISKQRAEDCIHLYAKRNFWNVLNYKSTTATHRFFFFSNIWSHYLSVRSIFWVLFSILGPTGSGTSSKRYKYRFITNFFHARKRCQFVWNWGYQINQMRLHRRRRIWIIGTIW